MGRTVLPNREAVLWLRKSRGWSQQQFAKDVGLDIRVVQKLEQGLPVYPGTLKAIASAFHIDFAFLVNSLTPDPLNSRDFPKVSYRLIDEAQKAELRADFGRAVDLLEEAIQSIPGADPPKLAFLQERLAMNAQLGDLQRRVYKGTREDRIAYFGENDKLAFARKNVVHNQGLSHPTIILLFKTATGNVAWYERTEEQQFAGKRDFFGGHVLKRDKCPKGTAMREANEEVRLYAGAIRIPFLEEWFCQVGRDYEFAWKSPNNRERSSVFVVKLPGHPALSVSACDEDITGRRIVNIPVVRFERLSVLAEQFRHDSEVFADGAARVLGKYLECKRTKKQLERYFP